MIRKKFLCMLLALTMLVAGAPMAVSAVDVVIPTKFGDRLFSGAEYEHYLMTAGTNTTLLLYNGELELLDFVDNEIKVRSSSNMLVYKSQNDFIPETITAGSIVQIAVIDVEDWATDIPLSFSKEDKQFSFTVKGPEGLTGQIGAESIIVMNILPTVVNITVPLNIAATIDVNEEDGFVHGDIQIRNNTQAPVKVSVAKLASTDLPFENLIIPEELPKYLSWETLGVSDSMKYFSLGIRATNSSGTPWKSKQEDFVYTYPNLFTTALGVIEASSSSNLELDSFYGRASMSEKQFSFDVTFVAELEQ